LRVWGSHLSLSEIGPFCRVYVLKRCTVVWCSVRMRRDFRHEKTKKKRGSYLGGAIDPNASFSFKYDSDDE